MTDDKYEKKTLSIKDDDKVYEFVNPDFECELFSVRKEVVFGIALIDMGHSDDWRPLRWNAKGIIYGKDMEEYNLTPIVKEKHWYEVESNFPRICWYGNRELESVIIVKNKVKYLEYINHDKTLDPLTNEEIESLKDIQCS